MDKNDRIILNKVLKRQMSDMDVHVFQDVNFSVTFEKEFTHIRGVERKYYDKILRYFKKNYCANGTAVWGVIYVKGDFREIINIDLINSIIHSDSSSWSTSPSSSGFLN